MPQSSIVLMLKCLINNYINKYSCVTNYRLGIDRLFYTVFHIYVHTNICIPLIFDFARLTLIYNTNFEILFNKDI